MRNWRAGKEKKATANFQRLARAIIARLPTEFSESGQIRHRDKSEAHPLTLTLESLAKTGESDLLDELLPAIPDYAWVLCDAALWRKLHKAFGVTHFAGLYRHLLDENPEAYRSSLFSVLGALSARKDGEALARELAVHLAKLKPGSPETARWSYAATDPLGDPAEVRNMLAASRFLDAPDDRAAALTFVLGKRSLETMRQVLVPVLLAKPALAHGAGIGSQALVFSINLLKKETARPLPPFPNWTRSCPETSAAATLGAGGYYRTYPAREAEALRELGAFMADPAAETHDFRYPQNVRDAVTNFISTHSLDLDYTTLRKGSPHTLTCTKNDKSHQRDLVRRAEDEKLLGRLTGI